MSSLELALDVGAVQQARHFARRCCGDAGLNETAAENVVLIVSEAVTNAFVHGRSDARVSVTVLADRVLVEVGDDDPCHPHQAERDDGALGGRGLLLMAGLADRWGVRDERIGKTVWFEVGPLPAT